MVSYKATVRHADPNKADDPLGRGYGPRTFTHERLDVVEHWVIHILIEYPNADIPIVKVTEGPIDDK